MTPEDRAALHASGFVVPRPWRARDFADLLKHPSIFAIDRDGGFAIGRTALDEAELATLVVAPDHRRQGIGRALLSAFEAEASARGASRIFLEVAADNDPAIALYTRAGYAQAGRRAGYYRAPGGLRIDALVLTRALDAQQTGGGRGGPSPDVPSVL